MLDSKLSVEQGPRLAVAQADAPAGRWPRLAVIAKVPAGRWPQIGVAVLAAVVIAAIFHRTFGYLYFNWHREEYSHGFLIPPISAYLFWQRRALLGRLPVEGSWAGFGVVILGLALFFLNAFATVQGADAYALVVVIAGVALATLGWRGFKAALVPIAMLFLMDPLPSFWYNHLSSELQLLSSQLGVAIMRTFNVSVFLEGNVIDLGDYKLQVAEACSGLRYLFPLVTLGAIIAYLFQGKPWTRLFVLASTVPVTVAMNGLRIGFIGILVDNYGIAQAEGPLHEFEGWAVFMLSIAVLLVECRLLLRLCGDRRPLRQALGLGAPRGRVIVGPGRTGGTLSKLLPAAAAAVVLMLAIYPAQALPQRAELKPARLDFSFFPMRIGSWEGRRQTLEQVYLDQLQLDDYVLANFVPEPGTAAAVGVGASPNAGVQPPPINLYVAYYASQRTGRSIHSPSSCLPGGGWRIQQFGQRTLPGVRLGTGPLRVNRAVIEQGVQRMVVYYWFQERGRDLTSEYAAKWYLLTDALTRDRTDGALVRFVAPLRDGEDAAAADARLERFSAAVVPLLHPYLPD